MATYNDICVRVRSLLDDYPAAVYTNAFLLPIINQCQGVLASELESAGCSEVRTTVTYSGATKVAAGTTSLTYSSTPALPALLIAPDRLMERKAGGTDSEWIPMRGARPLPAATQQTQLIYWDWNAHALQLVGATEDRDVKMDYWASVSDYVSGAGLDATAVPVLGSLDFLSALTAGIAAQSRGQAQLASLYGVVSPEGVSGMAGRLLYNFVNTTMKAAQSEPLRRAPYAAIHRYPAYQTPFFKY